MLPIERREEILRRLMQEGRVLVGELAEHYGVTEETIRRDLEKLEADGYAKKTYGGAVRNDSMTSELPYTVRKQTNVSGKKYIGERIGALISDGDSVLLDSSTTALFTLGGGENTFSSTVKRYSTSYHNCMKMLSIPYAFVPGFAARRSPTSFCIIPLQ